MGFSTENVENVTTADGTTTTFPFTFAILEGEGTVTVDVYRRVADGSFSKLDPTPAHTIDEDAQRVTFTAAPDAGLEVVIHRVTADVNPTTYADYRFPFETVTRNFDRITMRVQEVSRVIEALGLNTRRHPTASPLQNVTTDGEGINLSDDDVLSIELDGATLEKSTDGIRVSPTIADPIRNSTSAPLNFFFPNTENPEGLLRRQVQGKAEAFLYDINYFHRQGIEDIILSSEPLREITQDFGGGGTVTYRNVSVGKEITSVNLLIPCTEDESSNRPHVVIYGRLVNPGVGSSIVFRRLIRYHVYTGQNVFEPIRDIINVPAAGQNLEIVVKRLTEAQLQTYVTRSYYNLGNLVQEIATNPGDYADGAIGNFPGTSPSSLKCYSLPATKADLAALAETSGDPENYLETLAAAPAAKDDDKVPVVHETVTGATSVLGDSDSLADFNFLGAGFPQYTRRRLTYTNDEFYFYVPGADVVNVLLTTRTPREADYDPRRNVHGNALSGSRRTVTSVQATGRHADCAFLIRMNSAEETINGVRYVAGTLVNQILLVSTQTFLRLTMEFRPPTEAASSLSANIGQIAASSAQLKLLDGSTVDAGIYSWDMTPLSVAKRQLAIDGDSLRLFIKSETSFVDGLQKPRVDLRFTDTTYEILRDTSVRSVTVSNITQRAVDHTGVEFNLLKSEVDEEINTLKGEVDDLQSRSPIPTGFSMVLTGTTLGVTNAASFPDADAEFDLIFDVVGAALAPPGSFGATIQAEHATVAEQPVLREGRNVLTVSVGDTGRTNIIRNIGRNGRIDIQLTLDPTAAGAANIRSENILHVPLHPTATVVPDRFVYREIASDGTVYRDSQNALIFQKDSRGNLLDYTGSTSKTLTPLEITGLKPDTNYLVIPVMGLHGATVNAVTFALYNIFYTDNTNTAQILETVQYTSGNISNNNERFESLSDLQPINLSLIHI